MVDAAVSKTAGGQLPCRFESDLRHALPDCVAVAQGTLDPLAQVRILVRQPDSLLSMACLCA
jgi:hypothetical protein